VISWFQAFAFKTNLCRYGEAIARFVAAQFAAVGRCKLNPVDP
jgi:hypothetical protein